MSVAKALRPEAPSPVFTPVAEPLGAGLDAWIAGHWSDVIAHLTAQPTPTAEQALLLAVAFAQLGDLAAQEAWLAKARHKGASRRQVSMALLSAVQSLQGDVALINGQTAEAQHLYHASFASIDLPKAGAAGRASLARLRVAHRGAPLGQTGAALSGLRAELTDLQARDQLSRPAQARLHQALGQLEMLVLGQAQGAAVVPTHVKERAETVSLSDAHFFETLQEIATPLEPYDQAMFYLLMSQRCGQNALPLLALDCLEEAHQALPTGHPAEAMMMAQQALRLHRPALALSLIAEGSLGASTAFSPAEQAKMTPFLSKLAAQDSGEEHGHALLLEALHARVPGGQADEVMIEIGTTRERVANQGSTQKLADFCADHSIAFTTVDMDPRNSAVARACFEASQQPFEAVTAKGEEFLASYDGMIDHVFIDAYDYDHGNHMEIRQKRYEAFLGERINEAACHKMHLDCARALVSRLRPGGLLAIDDTWQDETGAWQAKGATAVPYLLEQGFEIVEARQNAVLLTKPQPRAADDAVQIQQMHGVPLRLHGDLTAEERAAILRETSPEFLRAAHDLFTPSELHVIGAGYGLEAALFHQIAPEARVICHDDDRSYAALRAENLASVPVETRPQVPQGPALILVDHRHASPDLIDSLAPGVAGQSAWLMRVILPRHNVAHRRAVVERLNQLGALRFCPMPFGFGTSLKALLRAAPVKQLEPFHLYCEAQGDSVAVLVSPRDGPGC